MRHARAVVQQRPHGRYATFGNPRKSRQVPLDRRIQIELPLLHENTNRRLRHRLLIDAIPKRVCGVFGTRNSQLAKP